MQLLNIILLMHKKYNLLKVLKGQQDDLLGKSTCFQA